MIVEIMSEVSEGSMSRLVHANSSRKGSRPSSGETTENMRAIGIFFLLLATAALAWDANLLLTGYGGKGFSGILQIWKMVDETSLDVIQQMVLIKLGYAAWFYVAAPLMSLPAGALFGVIGLLMIRGQGHEIMLRAPTALEIEMMRQGVQNTRRFRHR